MCGLVGTPEGSHAQTGNIEHVATVAGATVVVHAAGSLAVTADGNTFRVLDLSAPESPVTRGTLTLTDRTWDLVVDNDRAYVANGFMGFVVVDPDAPTVRGSYEVVSQGKTVSIALADNVVLTTNNQTGLNAFDVSDPTSCCSPAAPGSSNAPGPWSSCFAYMKPRLTCAPTFPWSAARRYQRAAATSFCLVPWPTQ
ncbi:MAG: hypothetical protein CL482_01145 [Acidobacteria bacterium]|nr:hypothetical protein [Acidobacteriota bacterium]